jgi:hypothetical protein
MILLLKRIFGRDVSSIIVTLTFQLEAERKNDLKNLKQSTLVIFDNVWTSESMIKKNAVIHRFKRKKARLLIIDNIDGMATVKASKWEKEIRNSDISNCNIKKLRLCESPKVIYAPASKQTLFLRNGFIEDLNGKKLFDLASSSDDVNNTFKIPAPYWWKI